MSERYVLVSVKLVRVLPRSFIVEDSGGDEHVVGRSCVHGADEREVSRTAEGEEVEFRVFEWLARKENLI